MATLNTPSELRAYISAPASVVDATLQVYLDIANLVIVENLASAGFSTERLKLIELNLAAHFATQVPSSAGGSAGQLESLRVGQSEETYKTYMTGEYGLATSVYGQIAMALDTTGTIAGLLAAKPLKAIFAVV